MWVTNYGKRVQLRDVFLPNLTEVERVSLEKIAQEKIVQLGITVAPLGKESQIWFHTANKHVRKLFCRSITRNNTEAAQAESFAAETEGSHHGIL